MLNADCYEKLRSSARRAAARGPERVAWHPRDGTCLRLTILRGDEVLSWWVPREVLGPRAPYVWTEVKRLAWGMGLKKATAERNR